MDSNDIKKCELSQFCKYYNWENNFEFPILSYQYRENVCHNLEKSHKFCLVYKNVDKETDKIFLNMK